ncbi:protein TolR [Brachymonas sp. G13]|uniref:protein TolR n=1 Tax=Brachymonas wangyanguii TaxID=3130163 RepID=UPI00307DFE4F
MPGFAPRHRRRRAMNEINMVPFIDVMLVLLIIFMVTAPMIQPSRVDLPSVGSSASQQQDAVRIVLTADGTISVGRDRQGQPQTVTTTDLASAVQAAQAGQADVPVLISADKTLQYDSVMQVYSQLKQAGVQRIALAVQPVAAR